MCGIHGVFHYADGTADGDLLAARGLAQRHRGPDDHGVWVNGPFGLGQRRLAIVDVSPGGHQPMANEDETVWVTYNGELYNWPEMRPQLAARGHRFRGSSDTEMLLHLWEEKGIEFLSDLRGMFALALVDLRTRRLLLARDRVGKKPLFYHDDGRRIAFASELKCLLRDPGVPREVDERAIADYLTFQYVPSPQSAVRGVRKLPAAHVLVADGDGVRVQRYWRLPTEVNRSIAPAEAVELVRTRLEEAVRLRLMSDVPLGAFLSGGIDSSAVVALMAKVSSGRVRTFSIGFEEEDYSELEHARAVARHLGTEHHELVVRPNALDLLPKLVWGLDEPFADASMLPTFHVSQMARNDVTVALSGDGGDEACGGYVTYAFAEDYARFDVVPAPLRGLLEWPAAVLPENHVLGRKLHRLALSPVRRHLEAMSFFPPRALASVLHPEFRSRLERHDPYAEALAIHRSAAEHCGDIPALLHLDAVTYMTDDVLVKVDRTSMMNSLEVRAPLLDHVLLEELARLPYEFKRRNGVSKWVLREAVAPLLPPGILGRGKQGFGVPLEHWFGDAFGRLAREVLLDARARNRGWLDPRGVERLLDGHGLAPDAHARRVFALVCLELWAQCFLDRTADRLGAPVAGPWPLHPAVRASSGN